MVTHLSFSSISFRRNVPILDDQHIHLRYARCIWGEPDLMMAGFPGVFPGNIEIG